ncbi:hypothetical protein DFJ73DRAFT_818448 [Zopfochytrium polystomum]|nr:hypothetical protein DFJ73DRAFT_818448 [Zopfochytrium polystomum]
MSAATNVPRLLALPLPLLAHPGPLVPPAPRGRGTHASRGSSHPLTCSRRHHLSSGSAASSSNGLPPAAGRRSPLPNSSSSSSHQARGEGESERN